MHPLTAGAESLDSRNPFVIAELGTGHGGDLAKAFDLIDAAAESGADCAKFQCVFADEIIHPETGLVPLPGGSIRLFDRFRAVERDEEFYAGLKARTEAREMIFLCTPFGLRSAALLRRIGVVAMKIASPELNHLPLLKALAGFGLPTIVSSGVSRLGDIERALGILSRDTVALLHCVTAYPAPPEDYNLRLLASYAQVFGVSVGVSDHSLDPILVPALSIAAGGCIVEKHICLSRNDPGLDDPIALTPADFARMTRAIAAAAGRIPENTIADLASDYGGARIEAVLGTGIKELAASEAANYGRTNRSLHALREIGTGEVLSAENTALLRTEKILRPGLDPSLMTHILGRRARRPIPSGEGIEWEDIGDHAT
jgi:sialic acid synthase SpsE